MNEYYNPHLACCLHCTLENALLLSDNPQVTELLQAAIGALNIMGDHETRGQAAINVSICARRRENDGKPCADGISCLRKEGRGIPEVYLHGMKTRIRACDPVSDAFADHCKRVADKLSQETVGVQSGSRGEKL